MNKSAAAVAEMTLGETVAVRDLGEAFGATVVRIEVDDSDAFFHERHPEFTPAGQSHYLRLFGVSKALYDNQTEPTRRSILAAQKEKVRAASDGVYVLRSADTKYFFAAYASRIGWEDPRTYLRLGEKDGWLLTGDDERRGFLRFTKVVEAFDGDWSPALFADVPYLYGRPVALALGLYNGHVNAGMRDVVNTSGHYRFKMDEFASDAFRDAVQAIAGTVRANAESYRMFLAALKHKKVLVDDARLVIRSAVAEGRLPKFQASPTLKYLNVLERGGEVDALAPQTLQSMQDVVDALAFYGRENAKGSHPSQTRAETSLFRHFYEEMCEADGAILPPYVDLKEAIKRGD